MSAIADIARGSTGAARAALPDGRMHLNHGPIDLVIEAFGAPEECARAYDQAWARFATILGELVAELPVLRKPVVPLARERGREDAACPLAGPTARRMWAACRPFAAKFITPMAAVAGAVADEVLAAMAAGRRLDRAYVNNGGDIALFLAPGQRFETGIVGNLSEPGITARARIAAEDGLRGIATSGWRGRSCSLGIADSVTVLALDAAAADAAATMIANEVDADHPAISRRPARALDPDSDLGDRRVTVAVGALDAGTIAAALDRGARAAERHLRRDRIAAAYLELAGCRRAVGGIAAPPRIAALGNDLARSLRP